MAEKNPARRTRAQKAAMTCQQVADLIRDYLAEELNPEIAAAFQEHLRRCPDCVAFINTYKKTTQAVESLRYEEIPADMQIRVRQFLRAKIDRLPPGR